MKFRQHLREIRQTEESSETLMETEDSNSEIETSEAGPSTEEDLVGKYGIRYLILSLSFGVITSLMFITTNQSIELHLNLFQLLIDKLWREDKTNKLYG